MDRIIPSVRAKCHQPISLPRPTPSPTLTPHLLCPISLTMGVKQCDTVHPDHGETLYSLQRCGVTSSRLKSTIKEVPENTEIGERRITVVPRIRLDFCLVCALHYSSQRVCLHRAQPIHTRQFALASPLHGIVMGGSPGPYAA